MSENWAPFALCSSIFFPPSSSLAPVFALYTWFLSFFSWPSFFPLCSSSFPHPFAGIFVAHCFENTPKFWLKSGERARPRFWRVRMQPNACMYASERRFSDFLRLQDVKTDSPAKGDSDYYCALKIVSRREKWGSSSRDELLKRESNLHRHDPSCIDFFFTPRSFPRLHVQSLPI